MATEQNGHNETKPDDLDIPSINGARPDEKKRGRGPLGFGSGGAAQGGAGSIGSVAGGGLRGLIGGKLFIAMKLLPVMSTMVMGVMVPALNRAASEAAYNKAKEASMALRAEGPLPSDEAVAKMRQNTNLDNEALVRSKHAGKGMKFGDDAEFGGGEQAADESAGKADTGKADAAPAANVDAAKAAEEAQALAAAGGGSKFGESTFGKSGFGDAAGGSGGGGGFGGGTGGFGNKIVNYAPESAFKGGLKGSKAGKGQMDKAAAQAKALGKGGDSRKLGGRAKTGRGQLRQAMHFSRSAKGMKQYQASAAQAGRAFDGGTVTGDNASGIGAGGAGVGGEGLAEAEDQAAMDDPEQFKKDTPTLPTPATPPAIKNESCKEENIKEMDPGNGGPMEQKDYDNLKGKCAAQEKMNIAFIALAVAALACIPLAYMAQTAMELEKNTYTMAAGFYLHGLVGYACAAIIAAANVIAIWAAADALKYPDLKGQATGLLIGVAMVDVSAGLAMFGQMGGGAAVASSMASAGSNVMQGMGGSR